MDISQAYGGTSLNRWRAGRGRVRAKTGRCRVVFVGDSTTAGVGEPDGIGRAADSPPTRVAEIFNSMGLPASCMSFVGDAHAGSSLNTYDPRIVLGAGWAIGANETAGGNQLSNSTTTNPLAFTPSGPCDTAEIYTLRNTGLGTVSWDVDGGAATNIVTAGVEGYQKTVVTFAKGAHTLNLRRVSGAVNVAAVIMYDSTTPAVDVINVGRGSATSGTLVDATRAWSPLNSIVLLGQTQTVLNIGINDYSDTDADGTNNVPLVQFKANLQTLFAAYLAVGDLSVKVPAPSASSRQSLAVQAQYAAAIVEVAEANKVPVLDLVGRWRSYDEANALGYYVGGSDLVHPSKVGYADDAQMTASYLMAV